MIVNQFDQGSPKKLTTATVTIASGQSLSGALALNNLTPVGVYMPAGWDAATLTFQVSADGVTYVEANTDATTAAAYNPAGAASTFFKLDPLQFLGANYIKVRSGTSGSAVNQTADRVLKLALRAF